MLICLEVVGNATPAKFEGFLLLSKVFPESKEFTFGE
jgi:hypothetical protein